MSHGYDGWVVIRKQKDEMSSKEKSRVLSLFPVEKKENCSVCVFLISHVLVLFQKLRLKSLKSVSPHF